MKKLLLCYDIFLILYFPAILIFFQIIEGYHKYPPVAMLAYFFAGILSGMKIMRFFSPSNK